MAAGQQRPLAGTVTAAATPANGASLGGGVAGHSGRERERTDWRGWVRQWWRRNSSSGDGAPPASGSEGVQNRGGVGEKEKQERGGGGGQGSIRAAEVAEGSGWVAKARQRRPERRHAAAVTLETLNRGRLRGRENKREERGSRPLGGETRRRPAAPEAATATRGQTTSG